MANLQPNLARCALPVINGVRLAHLPEWPGYAVSDDGRVWSCRNSGHRYETIDGWHQMVGKLDRNGYAVVSLCRSSGENRVQVSVRVCKLVLAAFVGPCPPGMECCHDPDRNPGNNALSNLRYDTHKNNCADKVQHGTAQRGEKGGRALFTDQQILHIRAEYAAGGITQADLARKHDINPVTLHAIIKRRNWRHI